MGRPSALTTVRVFVLAGAMGVAQAASAGVTYDFAFRSTDAGGGAIAGGSVSGGGHTFAFSSLAVASACNPLSGAGCAVMDVLLRTSDPLVSASVSAGWDSSAGLAVASAHEWFGQGVLFNRMQHAIVRFSPSAGLSCGATSCSSFDGAIPPLNAPPSLPPGTYNIGTIIWDTSSAGEHTNVVTTVLSGTDGTMAVIGGNVVDITGNEALETGLINIVPEPATAVLLGLGLAALTLTGRPRRT